MSSEKEAEAELKLRKRIDRLELGLGDITLGLGQVVNKLDTLSENTDKMSQKVDKMYEVTVAEDAPVKTEEKRSSWIRRVGFTEKKKEKARKVSFDVVKNRREVTGTNKVTTPRSILKAKELPLAVPKKDRGIWSLLRLSGKKKARLAERAEEVVTPKTKNEDMGWENLGDNNCYLNSLIQALLCIMRFRTAIFGDLTEHVHSDQQMCLVCALSECCNKLRVSEEPFNPERLRRALHSVSSDLFPMLTAGDPADVYEKLMDSFHEVIADLCSSDDHPQTCLTHKLFVIKREPKLRCCDCLAVAKEGVVEEIYYHRVNAVELISMKIPFPDESLSEILHRIILNDEVPCEGCSEKCNYGYYFRKGEEPPIYPIVINWVHGDFSAAGTIIFDSINTTINIPDFYRRVKLDGVHHLVAMVCFSPADLPDIKTGHYICFGQFGDQWTMYDDSRVTKVGDWSAVVNMCKQHIYLPTMLFFEFKEKKD